MKKTLHFLFITLLIAIQAQAQTFSITGRCVDKNGLPVSYVTAAIEGSHVGTTTDSEGRFALRLNDSVKGRDLVFAHISHHPKRYRWSELEQFSASGSNDLLVSLDDYSFAMNEIEVKPGNQKIKRLNRTGTRIPGAGIFSRPVDAGTDSIPDNGFNFGVILNLDSRAWIKELNFDIRKNTFDTMLVRVVAYKIAGNEFVPLMNEPYYIDIPVSDKKQSIVCDLTHLYIIPDGEIYIGLETVNISEEGVLMFPVSVGGNTYFRNMASGIARREKFSLGLNVMGIIL